MALFVGIKGCQRPLERQAADTATLLDINYRPLPAMLAPWATFAVAGAPLWLSLLGLSSAGVVPPPPPQEQLAPLLRRTLPTSWVYRGDSRHPNTVRAAGGFRPQGDSYWTQDRAFNFTAHQEGNPADFPDNFSEDSDDESIAPYVTAFVSTSHNISVAVDFAENHGWIYQIHATPNMFIPAQMNDDFEDEDEIPALGGIPWSAVYAYAQMTEDCVDVVLTDDYEANQNCWTLNGDYNEGWNNFAMSPAPPEPATEGNLRQAAINFLDGVGAPLGWEGQFPLPLSTITPRGGPRAWPRPLTSRRRSLCGHVGKRRR